MPCLLSSKAQSFSPQFFTNEQNCNLFLLPLKLENEDNTNVLMLHGSQIVLFDSKDFTIREEIILESQIEAFQFEQNQLTLKLRRIELNRHKKEGNDTKGDTCERPCEIGAIADIKDSISVVTAADITDSTSDTTINTNNSNYTTDTNMLTTITSKNCTWTLSSFIFTLNFSSSQLTCHATAMTKFVDNFSFPILEIIKDDYVACVSTENELQILSKTDRKIVSAANIPPLSPAKSLIWIDQAIFVFSVNSSLKVLEFQFMQFISPTNGCNWPLVIWSQDTINVHRASAICPAWFKLKNSEVWDVLRSPIGLINEIVISADGSCLLVCGADGVALCDFFGRTWKSVPYPSLKHPKWLGSSHVVALTPDNLHLILIDRKSDEIMKIPIGEPEMIRFVDTYSNCQLLIQKSETISIFAFNPETTNFTFIKALPFSSKLQLKQAVYFKETLFTLDKSGNFLINNQPKTGGFESFLTLSTGHLLLSRASRSALLLKDEQEIELNFSPLAVLPFTNCLTTLSFDSLNFSLHSQLQSKFLLPDLFLSSKDPKILQIWGEDALFPLALEYILLGALENYELLELLQTIVIDEIVLCRAIVSLARKIEVHEASNRLFRYLPRFSPLKICQSISLNDKLNFLPYLAKSYFENEQERKESIIFVLDELFSKRSYHDRIGKVKEFLSAFLGLEDLFESILQNKIQKLWKSGRLFKAYELTKFTELETHLIEVESDINSYLKLDATVSDVNLIDFRSWLQQTQSLPKTVKLLNTLFP